MGFWGLALPGRFAIVLVPLLVIGMAEAIRVAPVLEFVLIALVAVQLMFVATYHNLNALILDHIPHQTYLAVFPTVGDEPGLDGFVLPPAASPGPVAHVDSGSLSTDRALGAGVAYTSAPITLRPGRYRVTLDLSAIRPPRTTVSLARFTITEQPQRRVLADRTVNANQLGQPIDLDFDAPHQPLRWTNRVVLEIDTTGVADLQLRRLSGVPIVPLRPRDGVIHDGIPLAVVWLAAIAVASTVLLLMKPRAERARDERT